MIFSKNVLKMEESVTMAVTAKARAMQAEGIDVISMSAGEPDFDTPQNIKDAAIRAIQQGFTKYTPSQGIPELRKAICEKLRRDNGLPYTPAEVIVGAGVKQCLFLANLALLNEGDEVIVPAPYWVTYTEQAKLAGATPVVVETRPENGLKLTAGELRAAITPRTKLLILNSPSNPSGAVYTRAELEALADVLLDTGVWDLSDEMYEAILYDGEQHHSIAALREGMKAQTLVLNGVSKTYAMTGWRIGYAAGPKEAIALMNTVQSQEISNPTSIAQKAALEALTGPQDSVGAMVRAFDERRRYIVERLNRIEGVSCLMPKGAFYAFPDVSAFYGRTYKGRVVSNSVGMCNYLLEESRVACVPGAGFGMDAHIRLSYATSMENIRRAMDRIEEGLGRLS